MLAKSPEFSKPTTTENICSKNTKRVLSAASDNDVKHFYEYFVMMEASHVTPVTLTCFFMTNPSIPDNAFLLSNSQFSYLQPSSANHAFPDDFWIVPVTASLLRTDIKHEMVFVNGLFLSSRLCEKHTNNKYTTGCKYLKLTRERNIFSDACDLESR